MKWDAWAANIDCLLDNRPGQYGNWDGEGSDAKGPAVNTIYFFILFWNVHEGSCRRLTCTGECKGHFEAMVFGFLNARTTYDSEAFEKGL